MSLQSWRLCMLLSGVLLILHFDLVTPMPTGGETGASFDDRYPVMVPVSSTVIPLQLFGKPKPLGGVTAKPRSVSGSSYISPARRMRLLERSRRPDEPVRLITKNSRQKDLNNNETH